MKSVLISEKESDQNFSFEKLIDLVTTQIDANLVSEFCHAYGLLMTSQALATLLANRLEWAFEQKNHPFHHELVKVRIYVILNRWIDIFSCSSHDRVVTLKRDVSSGGKNASSDFDIDVIRILEQAIDRIRNCQKLFLSADNSNIITSTDRLPSPEDRQILRELKDSLRKFNTVPNETRKPIKSKNTYQNTQSGVVKKSLGLILNCFKGKLSSNIDYHIPRSIHTLSYNDGCSIFLKESSKTISEQLCLFEAAVMRQVNWIELINYGRKGGIIGFTLENYIGKFSGMSRWMMSDVIYRAKSFDERLNIIRKMIRVADKCLRLNNFNSTLQIALVLKSQEVEALGDDLWRRVSGTEAAICEDLGETVDPRNEFKFLKRLTRESIESSIMPCIPCVGLWMADLEEMWDGVEMPEKLDLHDISNKTIMEKSNIPWQVIRNIGHMAMSLRSVQSSCRSYRFQNLIEIQEYIMHRCQNLIEGQ